MRVFITGATGFIGQAACAALKGHSLLALTRRPDRATSLAAHQKVLGNLGQRRGDWRSQVKDFTPDVCIHLAWDGLPNYSPLLCETNFQDTVSLYKLLPKTRFVVAGTCFEYGDLQGKVSETRSPDKLGLFAAHKLACRLAGEQLLDAPLVWVRPFFVYGPGQRQTSLLPSAYAAWKAGREPPLHSPDAVCDFIFVGDVGEGIARLATSSAPGGIYNLGTGQPSFVRDAVNGLAARLPSAPLLLPAPQESSFAQGVWADMTKTQEVLNWRPRWSLQEGIAHTVAAWEKL